MKKVIGILLLCVMCIMMMVGTCLAERWDQYYQEGEYADRHYYFIDLDSLGVIEYEGKRYLDVRVRRDETVHTYSWLGGDVDIVQDAAFRYALDVKRQSYTLLEWDNKYADPQQGTNAMEEPSVEFNDKMSALVACVKKHRPDLYEAVRYGDKADRKINHLAISDYLGQYRLTEVTDYYTEWLRNLYGIDYKEAYGYKLTQNVGSVITFKYMTIDGKPIKDTAMGYVNGEQYEPLEISGAPGSVKDPRNYRIHTAWCMVVAEGNELLWYGSNLPQFDFTFMEKAYREGNTVDDYYLDKNVTWKLMFRMTRL